MKRAIIAGIAGLGVAAGIALGAAPAQAAPCAWFSSNPDKSICGVPNVSTSISNAQKNLQNNLNLGAGLNNLGYALTHGVGSAG